MSSEHPPRAGEIAWHDLTVEDATAVSEFYAQVVGWRASPVELEGYNDFNMLAPKSGDAVAGVCHARGDNAKLPPQWLIYIVVEDVARSAARCTELGGEIIDGPRDMGGGRCCVIKDPAGAVAALFQP